ncbi:hypothetical protein Tco_1248329, partial [Tanacetum coccineum]
VAYELINSYPRMAAQVLDKDDTPLQRIIRKPDLFYSGTHYNLYQRFVYRHVPIENNSLVSTDTADIENNSLGGTDTAVVENQETPKRSHLEDLGQIMEDNTAACLSLAGRLAPIHKLNAASGAALQMQQELQWFEGKPWILFPIAALACLPIASFVTLQFPLLQELISSTYGHGMFGKEKDYRQ